MEPTRILEKQTILDHLLMALQEAGEDVESLKYQGGDEVEAVTATFEGGFQKRANVTWDSGTAMIRDVMRQIFPD